MVGAFVPQAGLSLDGQPAYKVPARAQSPFLPSY